TPPASSIAPSTHPNPLPQPRKNPLRPGGPRESELITYLDRNLDNIRYKRARTEDPPPSQATSEEKDATREEEKGYTTFTTFAKDLENVVDIIWVSGSPNLQIPYLLTVCATFIETLPLFTAPRPALEPALALLEKVDWAFSSLLVGRDLETGEALSGFGDGRRVSSTERVRVRSTIERARAVVMRVFDEEGEGEGEEVEGVDSGDEGDVEDEDEDEDMEEIDGMMGAGRGSGVLMVGEEGGIGGEGEGDEEGSERRKMIGRVFERTLIELGDPIGDPIGIVT
ncbi:hypothetical protein CC80DRAFT_363471, partial [Byssothecium circinans]